MLLALSVLILLTILFAIYQLLIFVPKRQARNVYGVIEPKVK